MKNRRDFLKESAAAALAGIGLSGRQVAAQNSHGEQTSFRRSNTAGRGKPKNVLFLMTDQHRPSALSINGNTPAHTPNLDALARSGTRFDHAYCASPICVTSRASLLTGLWAHNHGANTNKSPWPYKHKTMAHYFNREGYITGLIGKMHFVDAQTHGFDYHLDFNDWFQYLGPKTRLYAEAVGSRSGSGSGMPQIDELWQESCDPWKGSVPPSGADITPLGGLSQLQEQDHFESFVTRESIHFLKNYTSDQPFFLIASYLKPHGPFTPAARLYHRFSADQMKLPDTWNKVNLATVPQQIRNRIDKPPITQEVADPENAKKRMALYYASLAQTDYNVGQMLRVLHEMGLEEDTIVVYTADHGEMLGSHGLWQKTVFYEPAVGVPLIMRAPGVTQAEKRSETPVSLVSVLPTLLDLCGVSEPSGLDGESLVRDLREPERKRDTTVYSEYGLHSRRPKAMIRTGDYKYMAYINDSPDQMFNLREDPQEMNNLATQPQYAQRGEEMKSELFAWHKPS